MNAIKAKIIEAKISIHFGNAKIECNTAHKSGNNKGFDKVNKMNKSSTASSPAATRPKSPKI